MLTLISVSRRILHFLQSIDLTLAAFRFFHFISRPSLSGRFIIQPLPSAAG